MNVVFGYVWLFLLGLIVGAFGTLIGAGGGFILVPALLLLYPNEAPETITSVSLIVVFFNALSGSLAYARAKRIDYRTGLIFSVAAIPGAVLGAFATSAVDRRRFELLFGILMSLFSVVLLIRRAPRSTARTTAQLAGTIPQLEFSKLALGTSMSTALGFLSSFLGIGAGFIYVPAFIFILDFPVHAATATSLFTLALMSFTGALTHLFAGFLHHGLNLALALTPGVILGAQFGARLSRRIHGDWILRGLALAVGLVGLRFVFGAFR
jgi:uncharacterized membrane protein YfcA